ncbi:uncharacterized protein [Miscanthus floridulus]|uniref:uncharacterized protein n=1 Tax=Miscanthus floridulus TaxID=154761 RepID=UPI003459AD13
MGTIQAMDSHMTCEVCGNIGHSGNDCSKTYEEAAFINNGFHQLGSNGWNNQSCPQETQLAQIAAAIPIDCNAKLPTQPKNSHENIKAVTTRGGKTTRDPLNPNQSVGEARGNRKQVVDEQFAHFLEMIEKIHVSVSLTDVLHVPSYAKYIKDIINNKRPVPSTEIVKLSEESSATILDFPRKKKDLGYPTISCSIGIQYFDQALCDLGASVSVMPTAIFDKLNLTQLTPTPMMLQLANSMVRYPARIAEDIPVKIQHCYVPIDFVVLDMEVTKESTLIFR